MVTVLTLRDGRYVEQARVEGDEVYAAPSPYRVEVCPADLVD